MAAHAHDHTINMQHKASANTRPKYSAPSPRKADVGISKFNFVSNTSLGKYGEISKNPPASRILSGRVKKLAYYGALKTSLTPPDDKGRQSHGAPKTARDPPRTRTRAHQSVVKPDSTKLVSYLDSLSLFTRQLIIARSQDNDRPVSAEVVTSRDPAGFDSGDFE